jgi:hypothetical protein
MVAVVVASTEGVVADPAAAGSVVVAVILAVAVDFVAATVADFVAVMEQASAVVAAAGRVDADMAEAVGATVAVTVVEAGAMGADGAGEVGVMAMA